MTQTLSTEAEQLRVMIAASHDLLEIVGKHSTLWKYSKIETVDKLNKLFDESYQRGVADERNNHLKVLELLETLLDPDECSYDHHGYCQTHSWFEVNPPCPHKRAKELIKALTQKE